MENLSFLIVEDHEFQRAVLEQTLRSLGAGTVYAVANGAHAMRLLRDPAKRVDIVISDLMMPDVDGIELIPLLRKAAPGASLVLSSVDELTLPAAAAIAKGHGIRVLGAIPKPLTAEKLRSLLDRYLAEREAARGVG